MSKKHAQSLRVSFSQNFLTSKRLIERLLRQTNISSNDIVLEIGAGKGHITKVLLCKSGKVIASEIDTKLCAALRNKFSGYQNFTLMNGDFLRSNLPQTEYKVFSNIPFSITTDIVRKLTQDKNPPRDAWLVMEKVRLSAFAANPAIRFKPFCLNLFFDLKIVYHFQKEDFHPAPHVDVVLLHISQKAVPDLLLTDQRAYCSFVSNGFKYGLAGKQSSLTKRQISTALRLAKLPPLSLDGEILYVQWLCLFRCWLKYGRK